jgi:hypothetical protein
MGILAEVANGDGQLYAQEFHPTNGWATNEASLFFLCGGRGRVRIVFGGGKGKKKCEKVRGWGLQLCFGLFVSYKMGRL